jgi:hypothetical protein
MGLQMRIAVALAFVVVALTGTGCVAAKCDEAGSSCSGGPGYVEADASQPMMDAGSE